jgi:hypothetical protein
MLRILEVGIGLALVFTLVALICSILNEWLSGVLEMRGRMLWEGVANLVKTEIRDDICCHQLMQGLVRKRKWSDRLVKLFGVDRSKPAYIPTRTFVLTLLDVLGTRAAAVAPAVGAAAAAGTLPTTVADLKAVLQNAGIDPDVKKALMVLVEDAGADFEKAKQNIGAWFDSGMDRVTGWYKRWSQLVLVVTGLIVAALLGVDSIDIGRALWMDPILREATADAAEQFVESRRPPAGGPALTEQDLRKRTEEAARQMGALQDQFRTLAVPLHPFRKLAQEYAEDNPRTKASWLEMFSAWFWTHLGGFILTAVAASLGAPFWFDVLNKFINLRNAGRKPGEPAK